MPVDETGIWPTNLYSIRSSRSRRKSDDHGRTYQLGRGRRLPFVVKCWSYERTTYSQVLTALGARMREGRRDTVTYGSKLENKHLLRQLLLLLTNKLCVEDPKRQYSGQVERRRRKLVLRTRDLRRPVVAISKAILTLAPMSGVHRTTSLASHSASSRTSPCLYAPHLFAGAREESSRRTIAAECSDKVQ